MSHLRTFLCVAVVLFFFSHVAMADTTAYSYTMTFNTTALPTSTYWINNVTATLAACDSTQRPTWYRLVGGDSPLHPNLYIIPLTSLATWESSACFSTLQSSYSGMSTTGTAISVSSTCFSSTYGFIIGTSTQCATLFGQLCSSTTVCAAETTCQDSSCEIDNAFTAVAYSVSTPGSDANDEVTSTFSSVITSSDCSSSVSVWTEAGDDDDMDIVLIIFPTYSSTLSTACQTALTTVSSNATYITSISIEDYTGRINSLCYTTDTYGYVLSFTESATGCTLPQPPYGSCSSNLNCPGSTTTCDSSECVPHNSTAWATQYVYYLQYSFLVSQTSISGILSSFTTIAASVNADECLDTPVTASSGAVMAANNTLSRFNVWFTSTSTLSSECQSALTSVNTSLTNLGSLSLVQMTDQLPTQTLSTSFDDSTGITITGFVCGIEDDLLCPITATCEIDDQCGGFNVACSSDVCAVSSSSSDGLTARRLDITGTSAWDSTSGTTRLSTFVTNLKSVCGFNYHALTIGNDAYTVASLYVYPFNSTLCTQTNINSVITTTNAVVLSTSSDSYLLQSQHYTQQYQPWNVLDSSNATISYVTIKTTTISLPDTCYPEDDSTISCSAVDSDCSLACPYGSACTIAAQCGTSGQCTSNKCAEVGVTASDNAAASMFSYRSLITGFAIPAILCGIFFFQM